LLYKNINFKIYRIIILHLFYGCETWSPTLREECRLRVFENRVPSRIFGPKRDEVIGEWRKLHNEELNDLYCSPNIQVIKLRIMKWVGHVACMGREVLTGFWWGNVRERDQFGDPGIDGRTILSFGLQEFGGRAWTGLI
jgi:hypothetical protein